MKFMTSLLFIISMVLMVSCGGKDKGGGSSNSANPYRVSTFNAEYTPTKQYMVYYGNKWYSLQPYGSNGQDISSIQSETSQAILSGASKYPIQVKQIGGTYVTMFRVRINGILGGGTNTAMPQMQGQQQPISSGVIGVQSISLY